MVETKNNAFMKHTTQQQTNSPCLESMTLHLFNIIPLHICKDVKHVPNVSGHAIWLSCSRAILFRSFLSLFRKFTMLLVTRSKEWTAKERRKVSEESRECWRVWRVLESEEEKNDKSRQIFFIFLIFQKIKSWTKSEREEKKKFDQNGSREGIRSKKIKIFL